MVSTKVSEKTAVVIPIEKTRSNKIAAKNGFFVFGLIEERIVFLGSPCSSQEHPSSGLFSEGLIVNL